MLGVTALGRAAQPLLESGVGDVERRVLVVGHGLGTDHRTTTHAGELHLEGAVGLARVVLLAHLDVDATEVDAEPVDTVELVRHVVPEPLGNLDVAAADDDLDGCVHAGHDGVTSFAGLGPAGLVSRMQTARRIARTGRVTPVRPTWSSTPHSPAEGLAAPGRALCDYSPSPVTASAGAHRRGRAYT